jgi:hypothetical protein
MNSLVPNGDGKPVDDATSLVERLTTEHPSPVIVDLGRTRKSHIKALKKGEGQLMVTISRVIDEVRENLASELAGKHLLPVVILFKTKSKRRSGLGPVG